MPDSTIRLIFKSPPRNTPGLVKLVFNEGEPCPPDWAPADGNAIVVDVISCCDESVMVNGECPPDWASQPPGRADVKIECCESTTKDDIYLGEIEFADGSSAQSQLSATRHFKVEFGHGDALWPSVAFYPNIIIEPVAGTGEVLGANIWTQVALDAPAGHGEQTSINITWRDAHLLSIAAHDGATAQAIPLETLMGIGIQYGAGESLSADIVVDPYQGMSFDARHGETASVNVDTYKNVNLDANHGEFASVDLSSSITIPLAYSNGSTFSAALDVVIPAEIAAPFGHGESLTAALTPGSYSFGIIAATHGEVASAEMTVRAQPEMSFVFVNGEFAQIQASYSANLGEVDFVDGAVAVVDYLKEEKHTFAYHGEQVSASMSTAIAIDMPINTGEQFELSLVIGPSESLGILNAVDGQSAVTSIIPLVAIPLSVTFYNSMTTSAGIDGSTFFDLDTSCNTNHIPEKKTHHNIEMNAAEFSDQRFDGDRTCMTLDLQSRPRFKLNFFDGTTAETLESNPYVMGIEASINSEISIEFESVIDVPLCPGNFIPDGDNVYVELDVYNDTRCVSDYGYEGSNMLVLLEANPNVQADMAWGASFAADFIIEKPIQINFGFGQAMSVHLQLEMKAQFGSGMTMAFYVEPIIAGEGQVMEADLVIKYDVLFEEEGCLDNEYIYQNENGDPIPELFNPVGVELEPFQHDVRARCE